MNTVDYMGWVEEVFPDAERWQINVVAKELEHLYGCCENLEQLRADAFNTHPNLELDIESWKKHNDDQEKP